MRRMFAVVVVSLAVGAWACGGDDDGGESPRTDERDESPAEPEDAPEETATTDDEEFPVLLVGTATPVVPEPEDGELEVVANGPPPTGRSASGSVPVIVGNGTDDVLTAVKVSGTARDAGGTLIGSGESQGIEPAVLGPGQLGIGYVYFGLNELPSDAVFEFDVDADEATGGFDSTYFAVVEVTEHNFVAAGEFGIPQIVGSLLNSLDVEVTGPISVLAMCFDEGGMPLSTTSGFAARDDLEPGGTGSFSVDIFDEACPTYLLGASGFNMDAL